MRSSLSPGADQRLSSPCPRLHSLDVLSLDRAHLCRGENAAVAPGCGLKPVQKLPALLSRRQILPDLSQRCLSHGAFQGVLQQNAFFHGGLALHVPISRVS